jgi:Histone methylation protein DOT1
LLNEDLHDLLTSLEADSFLFERERLRERLDLLDDLDAGFGDLDSGPSKKNRNERLDYRIKAIRTRLEGVNTELYQSIRTEIMHGAQPRTLLQWIQTSTGSDETQSPAPCFAYDYRDEVVSGILQFREPSEANLQRVGEMVFYQPTPVRFILQLIRSSALTEADVLVDLGSGLGHVPLLASLLTGAQSLGIEVEAAYVASAQECAQSLHLNRVRFIHKDAREADLSGGTVFYLYSPFTGSILADVLERLRTESARRPIKICTLGPCTLRVAQESWLQACAPPHLGQIAIFRPSF